MLQRRVIDDSSQNSHQHSYQRRCVARIITLLSFFNDSCSHECILLALCRIEMSIVADSLCKVKVSLKQTHQLHANESTDQFTDRQSDVSRQVIALTKDVIVADSLVAHECMIRFTDEQSDEKIIALTLSVIVADSLVAYECMIRFTNEQNDEKIDHCIENRCH